jgi:cell division protein FtsB
MGKAKHKAKGILGNHWVAVYRVAWSLLICFILISIVYVFVPKSRALRHYNQQRIQLQKSNKHLEAEILALQEKQARFRSDPAFVELTARGLGMIKTNEHTYRVIDPSEH